MEEQLKLPSVARKELIEMVNSIPDTWVLNFLCEFMRLYLKKWGY